MTLGESIEVVSGFFNLSYVHNTGVAFSFLAEYEFSRYILPLISIVASVLIILWMLKPHTTLRMLALSLILAGAFGNFIDRLLFGYVIDFIHLYYESYHFAVFNIADSAITIGVILFLFSKELPAHEH